MKNGFYRFVGFLVVLASILGLVGSVVGLAATWRYKPKAAADLQANVVLFDDVLTTTAEGLSVANQSLTTTVASIDALEGTVQATAGTLEVTTPVIATLTSITQDDLPNALEAAQTSLDSAQESAQVIDSVMSALASLPLLNIDYDPEVPLSESLQNVSDSLDPLPESLLTIQTSLEEAEDNLVIIQADIETIAVNISEISASLVEAQQVVEDYQVVVDDLVSRTDRMQANLPAWLDIAAWVLTFIFVWAIIMQIGMLVVGIDLLSRPAVVVVAED